MPLAPLRPLPVAPSNGVTPARRPTGGSFDCITSHTTSGEAGDATAEAEASCVDAEVASSGSDCGVTVPSPWTGEGGSRSEPVDGGEPGTRAGTLALGPSPVEGE